MRFSEEPTRVRGAYLPYCHGTSPGRLLVWWAELPDRASSVPNDAPEQIEKSTAYRQGFLQGALHPLLRDKYASILQGNFALPPPGQCSAAQGVIANDNFCLSRLILQPELGRSRSETPLVMAAPGARLMPSSPMRLTLYFADLVFFEGGA